MVKTGKRSPIREVFRYFQLLILIAFMGPPACLLAQDQSNYVAEGTTYESQVGNGDVQLADGQPRLPNSNNSAGQIMQTDTENELVFVLIDPVSPGSISEWEPFVDPQNPEFSYEEIAGDYVEGTALKTSVVGNTIQFCRRQHLARHFNFSGNALETKMKAYLEFEFSGSYYNLPMIQIILYDQAGEEIDYRFYYGKDIVGGYHLDNIFPSERYIELSDNEGDMIIDLSYFGDHDFNSFEFRLRNYTCIGTNSVVFDHLRIANAQSVIFQDHFEALD